MTENMPLTSRKPSISLHHAARDNLTAIVDDWLNWLPSDKKTEVLEAQDKFGYTPLHYAAKFNNYEILQKLKDAGANLDAKSRDEKRTALHFSANYLPKIEGEQQGEEGQQGDARKQFSSSRAVNYLMEKNADVKIQDSDGSTALHLACRKGNLSVVTKMLHRFGKITDALDLTNFNEESPLHEACRRGHPLIVKELIDSVVDVDNKALSHILSAANKEKKTPLHIACQEGHIEIARYILKELPVPGNRDEFLKLQDNDKNMPFHLACESGKKEIVIDFIKAHNCIVDDCNEDGLSPLHIAAHHGHIDVAKVLIKGRTVNGDVIVNGVDIQGIDVNIKDSLLRTPLHHAAKHNEYGMIQYLLGIESTDVFAKDNESNTPLMSAVQEGHIEVFCNLLKKVDVALADTDEDGRTVVHMAAELNHNELLRVMLKQKVATSKMEKVFVDEQERNVFVTKHIKQGLKLMNSTDFQRNSPLHLAAAKGSIDCIETLLKCEGILTDKKNDKNKTPMHVAAENGHILVVKTLLNNRKLSVLDEDGQGKIPLHIACANGHYEVARVLLQEQSGLNNRSISSTTPIDEAALNGHEEVVQLLIEADVEVNPKDNDCTRVSPLHLAAEKGHLEVVKVLLENCARVDWEHPEDKITPLEVAIREKHESVAMAIVKSDQWEKALQHLTNSDGEDKKIKTADDDKKIKTDDETADTSKWTTPFRELIKKMPLVAKEVLNQCTDQKTVKPDDTQATGVKGTTNEIVEYKFKYLDDFQFRNNFFYRICGCGTRSSARVAESGTNSDTETSEDQDTKWQPRGYKKKNHPLSLMVEYNRTDLLQHPLVEELLSLKWKLGLVFHIVNLFLYTIFVVFLTTFALRSPNPQSPTCQAVGDGTFGRYNNQSMYMGSTNGCVPLPGVDVTNITDMVSGSEICSSNSSKKDCNFTVEDCGICQQGSHDREFLKVAAAIVIAMALFRLGMEGFQLYSSWLDYLLNWVNWVELLLYLCSIIFSVVFFNGCVCPKPWQWQIGSVAVFLAWIVFIIIVRKLPFIGIYVLMFENIFKTFWKMFLLAVLLIVAFSLAFYMLFNVPTGAFARSSFATPARALVKTMTMTTGEFEYDTLFRQSPGGADENDETEEIPFPEASFYLWIIFVIMMPILLSNLLIGLAVDDIKEIQSAAIVRRIELRVDLALSLEESLPSPVRRRFFYHTHHQTSLNRVPKTLDYILFKLLDKKRNDDPEKIQNALNPQAEPIEQIQTGTDTILAEMKQMKKTMQEMQEMMNKMAMELSMKTIQNDTIPRTS